MDFGVLETAVILGFIKIVCSLLYFPTLKESFNSVGFCCSCLLIFTDLLVTVFLTLLWLAKPWKPHFLAPSDVVVLRLLLFLDHTYGAVILLTTPLIAVDTACRLRWPLDHEKWGEGGEGGAGRGFHAGECSRAECRGACCEGAGHGQIGSLMHLPGFLCCLLLWSLCGCGGGRDWRAEGLLVDVCLQTGGPLPACLPDLLTVALQTLDSPSRILATFALSLVLALNMGVLRNGWGQGGLSPHTDKRREDADFPFPRQTWAAVPASAHHGVKTHSADRPCRVEDGRIPPTSLSSQPAPPSCRVTPHGDTLLAIPEIVPTPLGAHPPRSPCRTARSTALPEGEQRPCSGGRRGRGRASVLTGLACAVALCLFPPAMAVNALLVRTTERLAEWSLGHLLPASR